MGIGHQARSSSRLFGVDHWVFAASAGSLRRAPAGTHGAASAVMPWVSLASRSAPGTYHCVPRCVRRGGTLDEGVGDGNRGSAFFGAGEEPTLTIMRSSA